MHRRWSLSPLQLTAALVAAVVVGGAVAVALTRTHSGHPAGTSRTTTTTGSPGATTTSAPGAGTTTSTATTVAPVTALQVSSTSPANGASHISGTTPISVTFSAPLSANSPMPTLVPNVAGQWKASGPATVTFAPQAPFVPLSAVTLTVPGGSGGVLGAGGAKLTANVDTTFRIEDGSMLRLQQLLSELDYSPLAWSATGTAPAAADATGQLQAAYSPPAGTFSWRQSTWPAQLKALWRPGAYTVMTKGLVMSFQADHGLTVNGRLGPGLWNDLLQAIAANNLNTGGYNFALGNKTPPESLTIWHDGAVALHAGANTGIAQSPTADGTFPVYARYRSQTMRGTNPGGSSYADPVQFVAYFNGGDAVHYLARADYGIPQSLGCIELPLSSAAAAWPYLAYGTLVDVVG
ncbi:MAG: ErfK/YbiS/YcfS/YnhG family protein [Acidimicrobiaceae bacterium]|nr:ErfK/YbiS/YcfS/YnhG family protein [Acidimicrobiaceae bacterium]